VKLFQKIIPSPSSPEPEKPVLLLESPNPSRVATVVNHLEEKDVEYRLVEENKPLWEPHPHSTEKIYVRAGDLDSVRKTLEDIFEDEKEELS
jgi:hypothetical protein